MTEQELLRMAEEAGFRAALIPVKDVPVDGKFRAYCEENLCGNYKENYACPPGCGTVEEVWQRLFAEERALVLETVLEVETYEDAMLIQNTRRDLNLAILRLTERLRDAGLKGFCLGYGGCPICTPCKEKEGKPCAFPEKRISCMSAYCIDVGALAERCGLEFAWVPTRLYLFGMIAFHKEQ